MGSMINILFRIQMSSQASLDILFFRGKLSSMEYVRLLRPKQWTKNLLLFAGALFSFSFHPDSLLRVFIGFILFCGISGAVYIINDIADREVDRLHPTKKDRPIASGRVGVTQALIFAILLILAVFVTSFLIDRGFFWIVIIYLVINILYTFWLKHVVILDIFVIAFGFILRAVAGVEIIDVPLSKWFILTTLFLSLFLATSKRRHELLYIEEERRRKVVNLYTPKLLDVFNTIFSTSTIVMFALYIITEHPEYWVSMIFVIYGILRYLYLVYATGGGGEPEKILINDPYILTDVILFILNIVIIYLWKGV